MAIFYAHTTKAHGSKALRASIGKSLIRFLVTPNPDTLTALQLRLGLYYKLHGRKANCRPRSWIREQ